ncbi:MAG: four helix bundle protein [Deltaproteobacteria bacterium]|nr:four helix bundle protein [Deltaproteobacteria bacterium]
MSEELRSDFRDLDVWKKCRDIRIMIWKLGKKLPAEEKFRLTDQMIRASRSSTANIAEGYGRFHFQENIQFCRQSRGSLFELIDHVLVAEECEYITREVKEELIGHITVAIRLLNGYIKYLRTRKNNE